MVGLLRHLEVDMPDVLHPAEGPDEDPADPQGLSDGDFVPADTADDPILADLLAQACEDAGIPAIVRAPRDSMVGKIDSPADAHTILVRNVDLEKAKALLAERKAALQADQEGAGRAAEDAEQAEEQEAATASAPKG
jgi:hypothetical protein